MQFIDLALIHIRSGTGGSGCTSFRREKFIEFDGLQRDIDVKKLLKEINKVSDAYQGLTSSADFNWDLVPKL